MMRKWKSIMMVMIYQNHIYYTSYIWNQTYSANSAFYMRNQKRNSSAFYNLQTLCLFHTNSVPYHYVQNQKYVLIFFKTYLTYTNYVQILLDQNALDSIKTW